MRQSLRLQRRPRVASWNADGGDTAPQGSLLGRLPSGQAQAEHPEIALVNRRLPLVPK